ncbi:MAG: Na+/H+ antiporter subunit D [Anaerolineae bacterium]|nr:Na+/H+ antiporter subunit D [Anaerolineae bacterium]
MIVFVVIAPLTFAILMLLLSNRPQIQRWISLLASATILTIAVLIFRLTLTNGIQTIQAGNWRAPFGITLVVDTFSAVMLVISGALALILAAYSIGQIDPQRTKAGFYPLFFFLLTGVNGAFCAGDLFNLYVWFEVMLMASFVLIALGGERTQIEGAVKYLIPNLLASTLFLCAIGLLYNMVGTLNMAEMALRLNHVQPYGQVTVVAVLLLIAFGIKSALFPLFFWLPASYHTPPVTITALFSGLLTKVGVYALYRVFTLLFTQDAVYTHTLILILAGFTMVTGVFGATAQTDMRRLLSFHIISQIGYLLMGLGLFRQQALAAGMYFMVHVILAKTALFMVSGIIFELKGSYNLKKLGGLYAAKPSLSLMFLLPALSLAGLPPLSGFFAKLVLIIAGFELQQYLIVAVGLFVSFFTLYSMTKIWNEAFWKSTSEDAHTTVARVNAWLWVPTLALVALSTAAGVLAAPLYGVCQMAAMQISNPSTYITAVLGAMP